MAEKRLGENTATQGREKAMGRHSYSGQIKGYGKTQLLRAEKMLGEDIATKGREKARGRHSYS